MTRIQLTALFCGAALLANGAEQKLRPVAEGMLIEGFDQLSTMATIYNHPYYPVHMEKLGFEKDADWVEYKIYIPDATGTSGRQTRERRPPQCARIPAAEPDEDLPGDAHRHAQR